MPTKLTYLLIAGLNEVRITELCSQAKETVIKMNDKVAHSTSKNFLNESEPHYWLPELWI